MNVEKQVVKQVLYSRDGKIYGGLGTGPNDSIAAERALIQLRSVLPTHCHPIVCIRSQDEDPKRSWELWTRV